MNKETTVARVNTVAFQGLNIVPVEVQIHIQKGLPGFNIVGLPDKTIAESRDRVRASLSSVGLSLPTDRITVNLSPASLLKEGSHYDLSIILGLLIVMGIISQESIEDYIVVGELKLDGTLNSIKGVLPVTVHALAIGKSVMCPCDNANEAALINNVDIIPVKSIITLINDIKNSNLYKHKYEAINVKPCSTPDLIDVHGQEVVKRALEIAAAGGHHMLMIGPPGTGKSMLAKRLNGLLPSMTDQELIEVSIIASVNGIMSSETITNKRPFREPHHSCSMPAMIGGGRMAGMGEITKSHNGVLFLDELPEFSMQVLDSLRQPLESGVVTVSRVNASFTYPAKFQMIAAMNPCKCGYMGEALKECRKAPICGQEYQRKISGPFWDRIDIQVGVQNIGVFELENKPVGERTSIVQKRVQKAFNIQKDRYRDTRFIKNADIEGEVISKYIELDQDSKNLLRDLNKKSQLSVRGYNKILRVARTIADLANSDKVLRQHVCEAISYKFT